MDPEAYRLFREVNITPHPRAGRWVLSRPGDPNFCTVHLSVGDELTVSNNGVEIGIVHVDSSGALVSGRKPLGPVLVKDWLGACMGALRQLAELREDSRGD